jgi:hypothetical protein
MAPRNDVDREIEVQKVSSLRGFPFVRHCEAHDSRCNCAKTIAPWQSPHQDDKRKDKRWRLPRRHFNLLRRKIFYGASQ